MYARTAGTAGTGKGIAAGIRRMLHGSPVQRNANASNPYSEPLTMEAMPAPIASAGGREPLRREHDVWFRA